MKRLLFALGLATLTTTAFAATDLSKEDRDRAVKYLEKTRADLIAATKGLSDAQWNFKQASNRWSVAEVTEHIAASEEFIFGMVQEKVMKSPPPEPGFNTAEGDAFILKNIPDRTRKAQAPEGLQPSNRFGSPKDSVKHFRDSRTKTIKFLKSTKDLRDHAMDSPLGKKFDAYQWILFIAAHSDRHLKQLNEVKADPNFPKK